MTSILQPSARASSSSSSAVTPDQDSTDDYPKIGENTYGDPTGEGRLIVMVAQLEGLHRIAPADVPPLGDQKRPMLGRPLME
jgi:hypothetical protein